MLAGRPSRDSMVVYTHKGDNALTILRDLGLEFYFTEILTSQVALSASLIESATYLLNKISAGS